MALAPGNRLGSYEVTAQIGVGGMGEVYRATDTNLGRPVAIKVLPDRFAHDPERLARFEREAKTLAALNHPNIAAIYGLERSDGQTALVMEFVEGPTLADRIAEGPLPVDEVLAIAKQIADALEAAHEQGIVHRDLKPANLKLRPNGTVKVLDFGLAKAIEPVVAMSPGLSMSPTITTPAMTEAGVLLGTAAYMSPEQAKGRPVDTRTDIWAFGVVMYEMVTGKRLFGGQTTTEVLASVLKEEPDLGHVPRQLRHLLRRCLEKDPQRRLKHIGDALEFVASDAPAEAKDRSRGRAWVWIVGTAALLLVAAAAIWVSWPTPPDLEPAQFEIHSTEKAALLGGSASVSPDGRWVVFPARGKDGVFRDWLRALGSVDVKPLPGTESTISIMPPVIWSHDSRSIAFASTTGINEAGQLNRLDLVGGGIQKISDIPQFVSGGTWNRDNVIVFNIGNTGGLFRVAATGGIATPLTLLDTSRKEIRHRAPQFLPDGRQFLYYRASPDPRYAGVYVGSLDAKPEDQAREPLLRSNRQAWYAASPTGGSGWLVFLRDTTLFAQPFDPVRRALSGEALRVADQVGSYAPINEGFFSVSESGVLAYRIGVSGEQFQLTWLDRNGKLTGTVADKATYSNPAVSPDGMRIAVPRLDVQTGYSNIWIIDASGKTPRQLTFNRGRDASPVWSPDGKSIVFATNFAGQMDLYQIASDGASEQRLLLKSDQDKLPSSWSREGILVFNSFDPQTREDLWIRRMEGDGKAARFLRTEFRERAGVFSPDGHWIAYTSNESGIDEIWVRPFSVDRGEQSATGPRWRASNGPTLTSARWGLFGKELLYSWRAEQFVVDVTTDPGFHAGPPRRLFLHPPGTAPLPPDSTSDGNRFLYAVGEVADPQAPIIVMLNWQAALKK